MSLRDATIATIGSGVMAESMIAGLLRAEQVGPERNQPPAPASSPVRLRGH